MELLNLPYVQRLMQTNDGVVKLAQMFRRINGNDSRRAADLMAAMATGLNSIAGKLGVATDEAEIRRLGIMREQLMTLARTCHYQVVHDDHHFASAVYMVKIDKALGTVRNLGKLRTVINYIQEGDDSDKAMDWLCSVVQLKQCEHCDEWEYVGKTKAAYDNETICRYCADSHYRWSDYYNLYVHEDQYREARMPDGGWAVCHEDDENFMYDDDGDYWYHVDYVEPDPPVIGSYHSSKNHQRVIVDEWSKLKHRWFGVELEVEMKNHEYSREEKAKHLNEMINGGERGNKVFFENDGSLSNGFEIITQPMSLPAHHDMWQWLRDRDAVRGLLSHNTRTCGLHVHVNKDNLAQIQIAKIVTFINDPKNESMIRAIARRYAEGYCKIKEKSISNAHLSTDRYEAVNITGRNTIEFRIFKGSLKYESVIAAIEFCNALSDFCNLTVTNDPASLTSDNFIDYINDAGAAETTILRPYMNAVLQTA